VIAFTVSGLKALKAAAPAPETSAYGDATDAGITSTTTAMASSASAIPGVAKVVGGVGAGLILVIGAAVVIFKNPKMVGAAL
jgi:hypothetical protein